MQRYQARVIRRESGGLPYFLFNDTATTELYTLSLHDALPILELIWRVVPVIAWSGPKAFVLVEVLGVEDGGLRGRGGGQGDNCTQRERASRDHRDHVPVHQIGRAHV